MSNNMTIKLGLNYINKKKCFDIRYANIEKYDPYSGEQN